MQRHRHAQKIAALAAVTTVALAACGGTGSTAAAPTTAAASPTVSPPATPTLPNVTPTLPAETPTTGPSGSTVYSSLVFDRPFTITLPAGWVTGDQESDMSSLFLPMGPDQGPRLGLDIQEVPQVFKDPCDPQSTHISAGTSPADLAKWMRRGRPSTGPHRSRRRSAGSTR